MIQLRIALAGARSELLIEQDVDAAEAQATFEGGIAKQGGLLWLTDRKGRRTGINTERIAYVEIEEDVERAVGFSAR